MAVDVVLALVGLCCAPPRCHSAPVSRACSTEFVGQSVLHVMLRCTDAGRERKKMCAELQQLRFPHRHEHPAPGVASCSSRSSKGDGAVSEDCPTTAFSPAGAAHAKHPLHSAAGTAASRLQARLARQQEAHMKCKARRAAHEVPSCKTCCRVLLWTQVFSWFRQCFRCASDPVIAILNVVGVRTCCVVALHGGLVGRPTVTTSPRS